MFNVFQSSSSRFAYDSNGSVVGVCVNNAYFRSEFEQDLENVSFKKCS